MGVLLSAPVMQFVTVSGGVTVPLALAVAHFYLSETNTPANVYQDADLVVPHGVTVTADAMGYFAPIFFDPDIPLRMLLVEAGGDVSDPLIEVDPVTKTLEITAGMIADGAIEEKLGFTPVDPDDDVTFSELVRITKTLTEADGTEVGYRGLPIRTSNLSTTFGLDDIGKMLRKSDTGAYIYSIPTNAAVPHPVGARVYFANANTTNLTIDKGGGVTLTQKGDPTFTNLTTVTVAPGEWGWLHKVGTDAWSIFKDGAEVSVAIAGLPVTGAAGQKLYVSDLGGGAGLVMWDAGASKWTRIRHEGMTTIASDATAAFTWITFTNAPSIQLNVPITANRAVNLSTANAYVGESIEFTRTAAATGAFNWSIGGLKNLAVSTWCRVTFDGAAWYLAAYGAL